VTRAPGAASFPWRLFQELRQRGFALGPAEYDALLQAVRAGFGWESSDALLDLCCALWAKSPREREIVADLFDQLGAPRWSLAELSLGEGATPLPAPVSQPAPAEPPLPMAAPSAPVIAPSPGTGAGLPPITLDGIDLPARSFVLVPQHPLGYREAAQAWRRLRRPARQGPAIDLDVEATVERRCRTGLPSPPVMVSRRGNAARLVALVDREGSMAPFHAFVGDVCAALRQAASLQRADVYYFHDTPAGVIDEAPLDDLSREITPTLDRVLDRIEPLEGATVYRDPEMFSPRPVADVLADRDGGDAVVVISDAGAARGSYDVRRLLETVAFLKALRARTTRYAWLNPMPRDRWSGTTAAQVARHAPMFPLDARGMRSVVDALRGKVPALERPL
jgi:uncharacterized protein